MKSITLGLGCLLFFAGASAMDSRSLMLPIAMVLIGGIIMLLGVYMISGPQDGHPTSHKENNLNTYHNRRRSA